MRRTMRAGLAAAIGLPLFLLAGQGETAGRAQDHAHPGLFSPSELEELVPTPAKAQPFFGDAWRVPRVSWQRPGPPPLSGQGALAGKTVYLSPGHGFTYTAAGWSTLRATTHEIIEDLVSAETIAQFLIPYLRNMGAQVVSVRETDFQEQLVIVDDADATIDGTLDEIASTDAGWGKVALPISDDDVNPFTAGTARQFSAASSDVGGLRFAAQIPETGHYNVYVSYQQGADRAPDAHYVVAHAGGRSSFRVDQRRHGSTWVFLGRFWFEEGAPAERASLELRADSSQPGAVLSADAVRFGGGVGAIAHGGSTSERPSWQNNCRQYAQLGGAPASVFAAANTIENDDYHARPRFADWDHEPGEDAVYVAWHTNAHNGAARGTESFTYSSQGAFLPLSAFDGVPGSLALQAAVHDQLIGDLRAEWDASWPDRGKMTAYFAELNTKNNDEIPSMLVEVAFHDQASDAKSLRSPRFRQLAARAIARGIARYFAEKDGALLVLPPETPTALAVENDGNGGLRVSFRAPEAGPVPSGYRVYTSAGGYGFDDGEATSGVSFSITGLAPGDTRFVRVTSVNAAGESMPSETVGARVASLGQAPVLVVGGFDRLDEHLMPVEDLSAYGLSPVRQMRLDRMNDGSYAARHGNAISEAGYSFDGASDDAVALGDVTLETYTAVDWFVGESSLGNEPLSAVERQRIADYLASGGRLFVSGAELAWAFDLEGSAEERDFYRNVIRARYAEDDSDTYQVEPLNGPYAGLSPFGFGDLGPGSYDAEYPDTLEPDAAGSAVLDYAGGIGGHAAVAYDAGESGPRVIAFGFPFETIEGADVRRDVMARTLAYFDVEPELVGPGGSGGTSGAGGGQSGSGGASSVTTDPESRDEASAACACRAVGRTPRSMGALLALGLAFAYARFRRFPRRRHRC